MEDTPSQCRYVHHKSNIEWLGIEPRPLWSLAGG
jgi:hypothetical protein